MEPKMNALNLVTMSEQQNLCPISAKSNLLLNEMRQVKHIKIYVLLLVSERKYLQELGAIMTPTPGGKINENRFLPKQSSC